MLLMRYALLLMHFSPRARHHGAFMIRYAHYFDAAIFDASAAAAIAAMPRATMPAPLILCADVRENTPLLRH